MRPPSLVSNPKASPFENPDARAIVRLQSDHINRSLVPAFYRYIQAQDPSAQIEGGKEFHRSIEGIVDLFERAEKENEGAALGLWKEGGELGLADVMAGPCQCASALSGTLLHKLITSNPAGLFRAGNVLKHYRGFELPQGPKVRAWLDRLFHHAAFKATCSTEELYLDSYERLVSVFFRFH